MSQNDFTIANQGFPAFRADLNSALQALASLSAGATEPSTTFAYQLWYDSTTDILKVRNADNDAWITLFTFDQATDSVSVSGEELVDDTTPQLGGTLDANGNDIDMGANIITDTKVGQWDTAYGWGDHGSAGYAVLASAQTFTASQRGTVTADNDLSFDMNATNFFKCTPTGNGTLTFTNITTGQSGNIWLDNSGGHTISAAATTYIASADLTTISTAGVYFLSYYSDGTNVMVSATPAVTSAGA